MNALNLVHLNGLRALDAVGRHGSLAGAAEEMGITASAVSHHIIKAEAQLGRTLFERRAKGLEPTEFGLQILPRLTEAFRGLNEAVALAHRQDDKVLTISVAPIFASRWLVHRLGSFSALHPDISLRIDATLRLMDLAASGIDLGIRVGAGQWPGVNAEHLADEVVFPVCAPKIARELSEPADILNQPAVIDSLSRFGWDLWLSAAGLPGQSLRVRHSFTDASLCLDAAIAGEGVMLAWPELADYALRHGLVVAPFALRTPTGFGTYLVTPQGVRAPRKVTAFKAWLRAELAKDAGLNSERPG